jgi:orotate phosphoribosyltransferase
LIEAKVQNAYDTGTLAEVEKFLNNPREWQETRMGNKG